MCYIQKYILLLGTLLPKVSYKNESLQQIIQQLAEKVKCRLN